MKILIVGAVAGGVSTATRIRRLDESAEIILFEKTNQLSYSNNGLPYYLNEHSNDEAITNSYVLITQFNIDVRANCEIISIDRINKILVCFDLINQKEYLESYDKLVLSTGASAIIPTIYGIDHEAVFTLSNIEDAIKIKDHLEKHNNKNVTIIGGGYIGMAILENLIKKNLKINIIESSKQVLDSLDIEMANLVHKALVEQGVNLYFNTKIDMIEEDEYGLNIKCNHDVNIRTEIIIIAVGAVCESALAKNAGLELGLLNSVRVNDYYQTSDENIYAIGDIVECQNFVSEYSEVMPLAGPANRQGRIVANNIVNGNNYESFKVQGSIIIKIFNLFVTSTGMNEKQLIKERIRYHKVYTHPSTNSTYYPINKQISMKLLFDKYGKILGCQAIGEEGVDKRIDVIATVMRLHGRVQDLQDLELCYSPVYALVKDPINMLGFIATNLLKGDMPVFYAEDVANLILREFILVDVRTAAEFKDGAILNAINIPLETIRENLAKFDINKPVYLYCQVGMRSYIAARILIQKGYKVYNLCGGYKTYLATVAKY